MDGYAEQLVRPALDLKAQMCEVVEREIHETYKRIFRFSKLLDAGIHSRNVHGFLDWWLPPEEDKFYDEFIVGPSHEGCGPLDEDWIEELQRRWAEIVVGRPLPIPSHGIIGRVGVNPKGCN